MGHRVPIFRRLPQPRPVLKSEKPACSLWADTQTWAYCVHCRRKVGILGQDDRWNESVQQPAHKLCDFKRDRERAWWLANGNDMLSLWSWLRKSIKQKWKPFDDSVKVRIMEGLRTAMNEGHGLGPLYAAKIVYLLSQGLFDERCATRLRVYIPRMCDHYQSVARIGGGRAGQDAPGDELAGERAGSGPGTGSVPVADEPRPGEVPGAGRPGDPEDRRTQPGGTGPCRQAAPTRRRPPD